MNKLTAEVARRNIHLLKEMQSAPNIGLSMRSELFLQALEIAIPILEQQERGEGWIDWGGGECPVDCSEIKVTIKLRGGRLITSDCALGWDWGRRSNDSDSDIIAYRIIPERSEK